jgi:hypothetical protein
MLLLTRGLLLDKFSTIVSCQTTSKSFHTKMARQQTPEKRTAPESISGINSLIAVVNKHDRFKLLEDDNVLPANLDSFIHPIFEWFDCHGPLNQMLRLASQFLTHDSVLVFFVPLLYGRELTRTDSWRTKTYLSNPLADSCHVKRDELLNGIRQALNCLAHSIVFRFKEHKKRLYARTLTKTASPVHTSTCRSIFQPNLTAVIEITNRFMEFYSRHGGYATSTRCAQFRHDFLFASTLVHEIVHAIGVMRRGNLTEPLTQIDDPDAEWGYAWEHFLFGCVINPQDRTQPGTHLFMRKIWADSTAAENAGGKEYSSVPMSYVAQWFRQETWAIVAQAGPTAISLPTAHFKIQSSRKERVWVVSTSCEDIEQDIVELRSQWKQHKAAPNIICRLQTTKALQRPNVQTTLRTPWQRQKPVPVKEPNKGMCPSISTTVSGSIDVRLTTPISPLRLSRKRKLIEEINITRSSKRKRSLH